MSKGRRSLWVETTYPTERGEVLLPFRIRAYTQAKRPTRVRIRVFRLTGTGEWVPFPVPFPWVEIGFVPSAGDLDAFAEGGADAVTNWLDANEADLLAAVLAEAPLVPVETVRDATEAAAQA